MKIFVWNRVKQCSDNYHREGGVVVIAAEEESARRVASSLSRDQWDRSAKACHIADDERPDFVGELVGEHAEAAWYMPDAGCC